MDYGFPCRSTSYQLGYLPPRFCARHPVCPHCSGVFCWACSSLLALPLWGTCTASDRRPLRFLLLSVRIRSPSHDLFVTLLFWSFHGASGIRITPPLFVLCLRQKSALVSHIGSSASISSGWHFSSIVFSSSSFSEQCQVESRYSSAKSLRVRAFPPFSHRTSFHFLLPPFSKTALASSCPSISWCRWYYYCYCYFYWYRHCY